MGSTSNFSTMPILMHGVVGTYITFSILIAILNTCTISAILTCSELKTVTNLFVLSLSSADLILAPTLIFVNLLPEVPECFGVIGARVIATILLSVMFTSSGTSLFSILAIAVDRYFAVIYPYRYKQLMTPRRASIVIVFIWLYCLTFTSSLISYYISQTEERIFIKLSLLSVILPFPVYIGAIVSQIAICLITSVALYVRIFVAIRKRHQASLSLRGRNPQTETIESRRITQTMALVLGALIISWTPYTVLSVTVTQDFIQQHNWFTYVAMATILLLYANSFMNPIIYAARSTAFRHAYWNMLCYICKIFTHNKNGKKPNGIPSPTISNSVKMYDPVETNCNNVNSVTTEM